MNRDQEKLELNPSTINKGKFEDFRDIMSYCITFLGVISFVVPLIALKHDKQHIDKTGITNTIFMVLSISFPYFYFVFSIFKKKLIYKKRFIMFLLILGLCVVNLYVLITNQSIKHDKIQFEFIINFGVGLLLFFIYNYFV